MSGSWVWKAGGACIERNLSEGGFHLNIERAPCFDRVDTLLDRIDGV